MKKFMSGMIFGMVIALGIGVFAANVIQVSTVDYKIFCDGKEVTSEKINYNGRTYIELRESALLMGGTVEWDNKTRIGNIYSKDYTNKVKPISTVTPTMLPTATPTPTLIQTPMPTDGIVTEFKNISVIVNDWRESTGIKKYSYDTLKSCYKNGYLMVDYSVFQLIEACHVAYNTNGDSIVEISKYKAIKFYSDFHKYDICNYEKVVNYNNFTTKSIEHWTTYDLGNYPRMIAIDNNRAMIPIELASKELNIKYTFDGNALTFDERGKNY